VHPLEDEVANQVDNTLSFRPQHFPQPCREGADPSYDVRVLEGDVSMDDKWNWWWLKAQCIQRWPHLNCKASEYPDSLGRHYLSLALGKGGCRLIPEGLLSAA
jgi:hypothetical protein